VKLFRADVEVAPPLLVAHSPRPLAVVEVAPPLLVALSPGPPVALPSVVLSPRPLADVEVASPLLDALSPRPLVALHPSGYFDAFDSPVHSPVREYAPNHVFPPMPSPAPVSHNGVNLYLSGAGNKRSADNFGLSDDAGSDSDDGGAAMQEPNMKVKGTGTQGKHTIPFSRYAVKLPPTKAKNINAKKTKSASKSSSAASSMERSDSATGEDDGEKSGKKNKTKMARISKGEREAVCDWIHKLRKDGKVTHVIMRPATLPHVSLDAERALDSQWWGQRLDHDGNIIRGQNLRSLRGACNVMYIIFVFVLFVLWLRRFVNRRLRSTEDPIVWTKDIARKRWLALCVTCFLFLCLFCFQ
jgi:hypothetical protein